MLVGDTLITRRVRSGGDCGSQIPAFSFPHLNHQCPSSCGRKSAQNDLVSGGVSRQCRTETGNEGQRKSSNGAGSSVTRRPREAACWELASQNKEAKAKVEAEIER